MATTRKTSRRVSRNTKTGSNVSGIQKTINRDYGLLARDYKKLFVELFRKPVTRYVLGGVAVTALAPVLFRNIRRIPMVDSFLSENMENLDLDGIRSKVTDTISSFRSEISGSGVSSSDISDIQ
jgi:hypothetical protein